MMTRDRALAWLSIGCLLAVSGNAYLVHSRDHMDALSKGFDNQWGTFLFYFHTIILIVIAGAALALVVRGGRGKPIIKLNWVVIRFQDPITQYIVLLGISLVQFGFLLTSSRLRSTALFFLGLFLILSLLWLFYHRERLLFEQIINSVTWVILLVYTRITFSDFISILEDPYWLVAMRVLWAGILVVVASLPLLSLLSYLRKRIDSGIFKPLKIPSWLVAFFLFIMAILTLMNQTAGKQGTPLWGALRFGGLIGIWLVGNTALVINSATNHLGASRYNKMSERQYNLSLFLIALLFLIIVTTHFINVPIRINPDGLSYLTMARNFAEGELVIRGLWAPLLPLLIAPLILLGIEPTTAWRYIAGASGLFWALSLVFLAGRFRLSKFSKVAIALSIALLSFRITSNLIVPDVLGAIILTWYFYVLTGKKFLEKPISCGIVVGVLGGLSYYARHYNLPFVIANLLVTGVIWLLQGRERKSVVAAVSTGLITLLLVVTPWIAALSSRYGQFTVSTSWSINRSVIGPEGVTDVSRRCWGQTPCKTLDDVLFPWEDPPLQYYPASDWNPFVDEALFQHQFHLFSEGLSKWLHFLLFSYGAFPLFGLIVLTLLTFALWSDQRRRFLFSWAIITALLYAFGYITFGGGESRYHLPYIPLLLMAVYYLIDKTSDWLEVLFSESNKKSVVVICLLTYGIPVLSLVKIPTIVNELQRPQLEFCEKQEINKFADQLLAPMVGSGASINHLAYQTQVQTYGVLPIDTNPSEADNTLNELSVKTFVALMGSDLEIALIENYGYQLVGTMMSCEVDYSILRVPQD